MFIKLTEGVLAYLRAKEMQAALAELSDAALDDIGLTRAGRGRIFVQPEATRPEAARPTGSPFAPFAQAA